MRTVSVTVVIAIMCALAAWANDRAIVGRGGTWKPLQGEHASIRMVSERVRVDVYEKYYDVQASFVFRNEGPATTVTMGFPESGGGDVDPAKY